MSTDSPNSTDSSHLAAMRNDARAAILAKRKAEARGVLGRLVTQSEDKSDRENLDRLIQGVKAEVDMITRERAPIRKRLLDGGALEQIQNELNDRIPHWRAFVNDLPDLQLVRDGLPANEDPRIKQSLKELEKKLALGLVQEVLAEWEQLGEPKSAAGGLFVQIVEEFASITDNIEQSNWNQTKIHAARLTALLETEESSEYKEGCMRYLKPLRNRNFWELLIAKKLPEGKDREKIQSAHLQELIMAKDEISRQAANNSKLKELLERVENAIDYHSNQRLEQPRQSNGLKVVVVMVVAVILIILAIWLYMRNSAGSAIHTHLESRLDLEADLAHNSFAPTTDIEFQINQLIVSLYYYGIHN